MADAALIALALEAIQKPIEERTPQDLINFKRLFLRHRFFQKQLATLQLLCQNAEARTFSPGQIVFSQGEASECNQPLHL
jgi:hypothetical protein